MESDMDASSDQKMSALQPEFSDDINKFPPAKQFIFTLQKFPVLWQKAHPHYTNKYKRNEALRQLLVILKQMKPDATIEHVRMKINSIRSNYRRELKKVLASKRCAASPDEVYTPKAWSFKHLGFLYNNEDVEKMLDSGEGEEEQQECSAEVTYDSDTASHSSGVYFEYTPPPSKKVKTENAERQNDPLDSTSTCAVSPEPSTSVICNYNQPTANSNNYIAFEWVETLNRLDPLQRLYAKKAINDILFEAELGKLKGVKESSNSNQ